MFTFEDFKNGLKNLYSFFDIKENPENNTISLIKTITEYSEITIDDVEEISSYGFSLDVSEIKALLSKFSSNDKFVNNFFCSTNSIEAMVEYQGRSRILMSRENIREKYNASFLDYNINIGRASQEFVLAFICACADQNFQSKRLRIRFYDMENINCFDDLCQSLRLLTVTINKSNLNIPFSKIKSVFQSYLFNLAYNYDMCLALSNENESDRLMRHRARREGQLFPYKAYNPELVKYYNQGLSSDAPLAQYLAYYHVAEFFFQSISEQDVFQEIESYITSPSFSPYSKTSIKDFYKKIKKKIQAQKDNDVWDERNALLLCLKQYVPDISKLVQTISNLDTSAINYYSNTDVPFAAEGKAINFTLTSEEVYPVLRNRVYSVRNAIVHSKEGEKLRYEPFIHDKTLAKEIPLIRAIAEEIIINSAKPLKFDN